jgi:signal transduction histidine kinase
VLDDAARPLASAFEAKGVRLAVARPPAPLRADVDPHRMAQVLQNLLTNALKATPAGGEVRVAVAERAGSAVIEVADAGAGVPAELRERIFERGFQADGGGPRRADGLGLGLAIVRAIVEEGHGGRLAVGEAEPRGAVFSVSVPLRRPGA